MWDGIKALGTGSGVSSTANGQVNFNSGTIENAFTGILNFDVDPTNPIAAPGPGGAKGMRIRCDGGTFRNNVHGVVLRSLSNSNANTTQPFTRFTDVEFVTDAVLNYPNLTPVVHLYSNTHSRLNIKGCAFRGDPSITGDADVAGWGRGIESYNTELRIEPSTNLTPLFVGLRSGCFADNPGGKMVRVRSAAFRGCGHGLGIVGADQAQVTECDWKEPDLDMVGQGLGGPVYGTFLEETAVILFENNSFWTEGLNYDYACVGSTFLNLGAVSNVFNNNMYDEFDCANCTGVESVGVTIQGTNSDAGLTPGAGIKFRCNQFSSTYFNAYDMAFTGGNVTVDPEQGTISPTVDPAGNTFALNCTGEQHMYNDGGATGINVFQYVHHAPQPGVELVPTCLSAPLSPGINTNSGVPYTDCAGPQNMMMMMSPGDQSAAAENAANEHALLKAVYEDWTDGGDTDGLEDYVQNGANSSYDVRNQLMLVAPKVSSKVWALVFERNPALNPWHLAQALIANSPLEPEVLAMMDQSGLSAYYRQLVNNEQNGISMHSIYQSELGYWLGEQSKAVFAYSGSAFDETPAVTFAEAIALHQQYPVPGSTEELVRLHQANNDLANARALINDQLAAPHTTWWDVQDLWLAHTEAGLEHGEVDAPLRAQLQTYAGASDIGAGLAKGWLALLGEPFMVNIVLPSEAKSAGEYDAEAPGTVPSLMGVHPNPSRGDAYITYNLPEGMEGAEVVVTDAIGRVVWQRATARNSGIEELPRAVLQPGLYHVVLKADGLRLASTKFTSIR